jgi:hypothetical protein
LEPVRSVYKYSLGALLHMSEINDEVERELSSISKDCYQTVVPRLVASLHLCRRALSLQRYSLRMGPRVKRAPGLECTN